VDDPYGGLEGNGVWQSLLPAGDGTYIVATSPCPGVAYFLPADPAVACYYLAGTEAPCMTPLAGGSLRRGQNLADTGMIN
jgi:hypothetical protein